MPEHFHLLITGTEKERSPAGHADSQTTCLTTMPEEAKEHAPWRWSSFRFYRMGERGVVKVEV
jgi:hypothetical protein